MRFLRWFIYIAFNQRSISRFLKHYFHFYYNFYDAVIFFCTIFFYIIYVLCENDLTLKYINLFGLIIFLISFISRVFDSNEVDKHLSDLATAFLILMFAYYFNFSGAKIIALNMVYPHNEHLLQKLYTAYMTLGPFEEPSIDGESKPVTKRSLSFATKVSPYLKYGAKTTLALGAVAVVYKTGVDYTELYSSTSNLMVEAKHFSDKCLLELGEPGYKESLTNLTEKKNELREVIAQSKANTFIKEIYNNKVDNIPTYKFGEPSFLPKNIDVNHKFKFPWQK